MRVTSGSNTGTHLIKRGGWHQAMGEIVTTLKMSGGIRHTCIAAAISCAVNMPLSDPAEAQQPAGEDSLRTAIEALQAGQDEIQRDLAEIKKLLRQRPSMRAQPPAFKPRELSTAGAPVLGTPDAPVTIIEFTDYQCPFCSRYAINTLPEIVRDYVDPGDLRYVVRELPVEQRHPLAGKAAEAALCAGAQGKYWAMHDALFKNQDRLKTEDLEAHAQTLTLDMGQFWQCLHSGEYEEHVRQDVKTAIEAGVRGTPAFFLGLTDPEAPDRVRVTQMINGAQPYSAFQGAIDHLLAQARAASPPVPTGNNGDLPDVRNPPRPLTGNP